MTAASESTLGNLVADSLVDTLKAPGNSAAPRSASSTRAACATSCTTRPDGTITYAEANAVLPFVNNLWTTSLTGAQFKTLLEQQWQTNAGRHGSQPRLPAAGPVQERQLHLRRRPRRR